MLPEGKHGMMEVSWISLRTTTIFIITILQIQALTSIKTKALIGLEGQSFDFICEYPDRWLGNAKYLCPEDDDMSRDTRILIDKHDDWVTKGRYSLFDNTTGAFFIVRVHELKLEDSGTYVCGVDVPNQQDHISMIQLKVTRANPPDNLTHQNHNLPLYLTAVMCTAAMLFVCLFTLSLLLAVRRRTSGPSRGREASSEYETMTPGVGTEPEHHSGCSAPEYAQLPALTHQQPELPYPSTAKCDSSRISHIDEYVDLDVERCTCQYQHLDLSRLEEHVYHSLHGSSGPKN